MKTIEEMQSVMFDINADLDACVYGYNHLLPAPSHGYAAVITR